MQKKPLDEEKVIKIDLGKMVPLGLIPFIIITIVLLAASRKFNQIHNNIKTTVDSINIGMENMNKNYLDLKIKVDSISTNTDNILKVTCDKIDRRTIILSGLKCL